MAKTWISEEERGYQAVQEKRWQLAKQQVRAKKRRAKARARQNLKDITAQCESLAKKSRAYLKVFWPKFREADLGIQRITLLKKASHPGWPNVEDAIRNKLRARYRKIRFTLLDVPIEVCAACGNAKAREKHHIIPLMFGGPNENENLVAICFDCHDQIHPWMKGGQ